MKRNFLQDVIPPNQKRSIRNIPISRRRTEVAENRDFGIDNDIHTKVNDVKSSHNIPPQPPQNSNIFAEEYEQESSGSFKKIIFGIILIFVVIPLVYIFGIRQKAEIVIEPKTETAYASASFEISKNNVEKGDSYIDYKVSKIENQVNEWIKDGIEVQRLEMNYEDAKKMGAIGVFDDKYENIVSVYKIGDVSMELCGGPHVKNTNEIGNFKIVKEESSSKGVRRIKAVLG